MKFQPGQSGNKSGRPLGSKNKHTQYAQLLELHAEKLIEKVIELALNGDVNALRLCMERLIPKVRNDPITLNFDLSQINKQEYLMNFGREILTAVANGDISPADAKILSSAADTHRKLIENSEMRRMLDEIEHARKTGR